MADFPYLTQADLGAGWRVLDAPAPLSTEDMTVEHFTAYPADRSRGLRVTVAKPTGAVLPVFVGRRMLDVLGGGAQHLVDRAQMVGSDTRWFTHVENGERSCSVLFRVGRNLATVTLIDRGRGVAADAMFDELTPYALTIADRLELPPVPA